MGIPDCTDEHDLNELEEKWIVINHFPNYSVSNHGRIKSEKTGRLLNISIGRGGTASVALMGTSQQYRRGIARLVADRFMKPATEYAFETPIHLNGIVSDNHVYNMMWRPKWFAVKYHAQFRGEPFYIPDAIADRDTGTVYDNPLHAAQANGLLINDVMYSLLEQGECWPTKQTFELV